MYFGSSFLHDTATPEIYTLSLHDALPIYSRAAASRRGVGDDRRTGWCGSAAHARGASRDAHEPRARRARVGAVGRRRSEEHTSELQSHVNLVCRLLLEKKKKDRRTVDNCA